MPKILVIEDEQPLLNDIMEMLEYSSYEVSGTGDGSEALEFARQHRPDLILCDIMMPVVDGYEVLKQLRQHPATATIPFIFITAKADRDSMRQGMSMGADDYLTKPFTFDELTSAINTRLQRQQAVVDTVENNVDVLKQQLARMVTHELRTPLNSMTTVLKVISRQFGQLSPQELQEMLETVEAGSNRLSHRVEQLVFSTQIESGLLSAASIKQDGVAMQMWELLTAATNLARRFAYQQPPNVSLNMQHRDRDAQVLCNPAALKQAFAELLANALVFAKPDGAVTVTQWRADGRVWVNIIDDGSGIPPGKLAAALEDFQQLDRDSREQQGIGMGLPLAKRIIEIHGGHLQIQSVVGKGTQVVISLPQVQA
jgi:two-component system sensor histidine kinase/response regulator